MRLWLTVLTLVLLRACSAYQANSPATASRRSVVDHGDSWAGALLEEAGLSVHTALRTLDSLLKEDPATAAGLKLDWEVDLELLANGTPSTPLLWTSAGHAPGPEGTAQDGGQPGGQWQTRQVLQCLHEGRARSLQANKRVSGIDWRTATSAGATALGLGVVGGLWTLDGPNLPVSIVTSASMDRIMQLQAQCIRWPGPLSAVLFQGLVQAQEGQLTAANQAILRTAFLKVSHLASQLIQYPEACQLSVILAYEVYTDEAVLPLYPINLLRNYARLQVQTPMMVMLDVDLLPSHTFYKRMLQEDSTTSAMFSEVQSSKVAYIVPAFEMTRPYDVASWADAVATAPSNAAVHMCLESHVMTPFYFSRWKAGHRLTNFDKWKTARQDYEVKYEEDCEPYFVASRTSVPWHDARYRGFGRNKIQQVHHMHMDGYTFKVLHDAYVVHRSHLPTAAQKLHQLQVKPSPNEMSMKDHVQKLYKQQVVAMAQGAAWVQVEGITVAHCKSVLHWWQGV